MADAQAASSASSNGVGDKKRRDVSWLDTQMTSASSGPKKLKIEPESLPEANPNSIEGVRDKNKALELELVEKNRRIAYLKHKCESLFQELALSDGAWRCMRRQWMQLLDDLQSSVMSIETQSESELWTCVLDESSGILCASLPLEAREIKLALPEWFESISTGEKSVDLPAPSSEAEKPVSSYVLPAQLRDLEKQIGDQLEQQTDAVKAIVTKVLQALGGTEKDETKKLELKHFVQEKRSAVAQTLTLTDELQACKQQIERLERDLEYKEVERHRACRDYDRLTKHIEHNGMTIPESLGSGAKQNSTANEGTVSAPVAPAAVTAIKKEDDSEREKHHGKVVAQLRCDSDILRKKLFQERDTTDKLKKEIEQFKASESTWKREEAQLKQTHEETLEQLREEKTHLNDEFAKIRHKSKDIEQHVNDKWKKKLTRMQADMTKVKSQMDELNIKNTSLREKLVSASNYREKMTDLKSTCESLKRANEKLQAEAERDKQRVARTEEMTNTKEFQALSEKISELERCKSALQSSYDILKQAETQNTDEKLSALVARHSELEARFEQECQAHTSTKAALSQATLEMKEKNDLEQVAREENDALLCEIDATSKEIETMRHSRKKLMQQVEEKRNSCKKLHSQLSKEEQAKAHCFEELAAARLQLSSLGTVHKQQKAVIESAKEALHSKEKELEQLKAHTTNLEDERGSIQSDRLRFEHELQVAKQMYSTLEKTYQKVLLQEGKRPCTKCEQERKQQQAQPRPPAASSTVNSSSSALQPSPTTTSTNSGLTDLERFELRELQKLVNCSVCQDRRKNVIISKCFHMFCKECMDTNLKARNRKCPTCKKMFGQDDIKTAWFT